MEIETTPVDAVVPPIGIGAALAPEQTEEEAAPAAEVTETPAVETAPSAKEEAAAAPATEKPASTGVLKGIQAERQARKAAEAENKALKERLLAFEGGQPFEAPATQTVTDPSLERKLLTISENSARTAHSDYEEKFTAFAKAAEKNLSLYNAVMESDHPGEAAYQAGKNVILQEKYGTDPEAMVKKIKEETETEMKAKIRAEVEAELRGKVQSKNNQPKNILAGRGAKGGEGEEVPVIGFSQLLSRRPTRTH